MTARTAFVVAVAENGVIGASGAMPWRIPSDLKTFKRLTLGKPVVMGRKTFDSIGKALPGRANLVVTRDAAWSAPNVETAPDPMAGLLRAREIAGGEGADEVCVIGGAQIYAALLPEADRIYWTSVHATPEGDTYFPEFDRSAWREVAREALPEDPKASHAATLITLDRA